MRGADYRETGLHPESRAANGQTLIRLSPIKPRRDAAVKRRRVSGYLSREKLFPVLSEVCPVRGRRTEVVTRFLFVLCNSITEGRFFIALSHLKGSNIMFVKILMIIVFIAMTVGVGVWCRKKAVSVSGLELPKHF